MYTPIKTLDCEGRVITGLRAIYYGEPAPKYTWDDYTNKTEAFTNYLNWIDTVQNAGIGATEYDYYNAEAYERLEDMPEYKEYMELKNIFEGIKK